MPLLYDGYHTDDQATAGDAPTIGALLTPRFLRLLHHPVGGLLRGVRINDATCDWHPNVPVRLYAARATATPSSRTPGTARRPWPRTALTSPSSTSAPSLTTPPSNGPSLGCWPGSST